MQTILKIGEVNKIYGVSLDTLRYYDKIGLLKPIVDPNNSYRYYSLEHLDRLEMILLGRLLDISLESLTEHLKTGTLESYKQLIRKQDDIIKQRKKELELVEKGNKKLMPILNDIESHSNTLDFSTISRTPV